MKAYIFNKSTNRYERSTSIGSTFAELDTSKVGFLVYEIGGINMYITFEDAKNNLPSAEDPAGFLPSASLLTAERPMTQFANFVSESKTGVKVKLYRKISNKGFRLKGFQLTHSSPVRLFMIDGFAHPLKKDDNGLYLAGGLDLVEKKKPHVTALEFPGADYFINTALEASMIPSGTLSNSVVTITPRKWYDDLQPLLVIGGLIMATDTPGITFNQGSITIDFDVCNILSLLGYNADKLQLTGNETQEELLTTILDRQSSFIFWLPVSDMKWGKEYFSIVGHRVHRHYKRFEGRSMVRSGLLRSIDYTINQIDGKEGLKLLDDDLLSYFARDQGIISAGLDPEELEVHLYAAPIQYNVTL